MVNYGSFANTLSSLRVMFFCIFIPQGVLGDTKGSNRYVFWSNHWFGKYGSSLVWNMVPLGLMWVI